MPLPGALKRFSIIVPTPDGGSLENLEESLRTQLRDGDEVLVVGDTHESELGQVREWVELQPHWRWLEHDAGRHAWGHPQINFGMQHAEGDYILFQDDDDVYYPDALLNIRRAVKHLDPPRPLLFRFRAQRAGGMVFWTNRGLVAQARIGGHCMVVPNCKEKLGSWTDRYEGDFDFIVETLRLWEPLEPVWRDEVIVLAR